jgi:membrane-bound metal-dependent hydrolase YbcI (DUF457 family)
VPGPIAHAAAGYLIYRAFRPAMPQAARTKLGPLPALLVCSVGLSLAPDLDAVPGVLLNDLGRFHNNFTHSLFSSVVVALATALVMKALGRPEAVKWGLMALVCYQTHLLMDLVTYESRGLMLLWPFSDERIQGPVTLFYGLRWSEGLVSAKHLITLSTELGLAAAAYFLVNLLDRRKLRRQSVAPPPRSRV